MLNTMVVNLINLLFEGIPGCNVYFDRLWRFTTFTYRYCVPFNSRFQKQEHELGVGPRVFAHIKGNLVFLLLLGQ
jgi:hypothetical protein